MRGLSRRKPPIAEVGLRDEAANPTYSRFTARPSNQEFRISSALRWLRLPYSRRRSRQGSNPAGGGFNEHHPRTAA